MNHFTIVDVVARLRRDERGGPHVRGEGQVRHDRRRQVGNKCFEVRETYGFTR